MSYVEVRKRYIDLEKKVRDFDFSKGKFDSILNEQLSLLQDLQTLVYTKSLGIDELKELGNITNKVTVLFMDKTKKPEDQVREERTPEKNDLDKPKKSKK